MRTESVPAGTGPSVPARAASERWVRLSLVVVGVLVSAYGIKGFLGASDATQPVKTARWLIGGLVLHDAVFAPLVFLLAFAAVRVTSGAWRTAVQAAALVTVALVAVSLPLLLGKGDDPANPTLNPLDYTANILVLTAVVWGGALLAAAVVTLRRRRSPAPAARTAPVPRPGGGQPAGIVAG